MRLSAARARASQGRCRGFASLACFARWWLKTEPLWRPFPHATPFDIHPTRAEAPSGRWRHSPAPAARTCSSETPRKGPGVTDNRLVTPDLPCRDPPDRHHAARQQAASQPLASLANRIDGPTHGASLRRCMPRLFGLTLRPLSCPGHCPPAWGPSGRQPSRVVSRSTARNLA